MSITLNLAPEDEAQLRDIAAQKGQDVNMVAYDLFVAELAKIRTRHNLPEGITPMTHEEAVQVP